MPNQVQVGPQSINDGQVANARGGNFGETIIQQYNGKYAEQWRRGLAFLATVPAQAFLVSATTGGVPTIINPTGSGKVVFLNRFSTAWISGTNVAGSLLAAVTTGVSSVGTGQPVLTATAAALIGAPGANSGAIIWSPTTNTFTAAPTVIAGTGFNLAATQPTGLFEQDYDSALAIFPGQAVSLVYSATTSTALFVSTLLISIEPYFSTGMGS